MQDALNPEEKGVRGGVLELRNATKKRELLRRFWRKSGKNGLKNRRGDREKRVLKGWKHQTERPLTGGGKKSVRGRGKNVALKAFMAVT